jgi:protein phosphatase
MELKIPKLSLVVLIGPSGSGKSTFAKKHFLSTEIISSDYCRALISDDENNQKVTAEAFAVLRFIAAKRLAAGKLTVIDATNVQKEARKPLVALAREFHCLPCAIVLDLPKNICQQRNTTRAERNFGGRVIYQQISQLNRSMKSLKHEGFRHIYKLRSEEEIDAVKIIRTSLWNDRCNEHGPFDIIGDVHGCYDELTELLTNLGYKVSEQKTGVIGGPVYTHPEGRKAVFLGDLVDRGPRILNVLKLVYNMVDAQQAICVPGNHDIKFMRKLKGRDVQINYGLAETLAEVENLASDTKEAFCDQTRKFLDGLVSHYVFDDGKLVVAHAGLKQEMQGRGSGKVREFCLYGETTGETDEFGLPVRYNWAAEYRGPARVVYGHTPVVEPTELNRTVNIDTGCVFGGKLTAFRYPEEEFISVAAKKIYCQSRKPIDFENNSPGLTQQQVHDDLLDAQDVLGKRFILTRLKSNVTIREENAIAALEVMSRYALNSKWLIYLPPTMSPAKTSSCEGYLEYPTEAVDYFRKLGVPKVICEEKHMGSRAIVIVCQDKKVSTKRFGVMDSALGVVYTRTGRRFFNDHKTEEKFISRIHQAISKANFWDEFKTDWFCFDCELMPWSEKAKELLKTQYAAVGASAQVALSASVRLLKQAACRKFIQRNPAKGESSTDTDINFLLARYQDRQKAIKKYVKAYQKYCWPVNSIDDLKLAPFHLLATEGKVYLDKDNQWHMDTLAKICAQDKKILLATPYKIVDITDIKSEQAAVKWWEKLTSCGGEGMVVKPYDFITRARQEIVQPALKCRGKEYLRIIYGPEYTTPENLSRLRNRSLGAKRSLAMREFALGVEGLERFARKEPLRRVHECVFGVLALESEPVDPRL